MLSVVCERLRFRLVNLLSSGLLLLAFSSFNAFDQAPPLSIELVVPVSTPNGKREIAMDRYPDLHVLIKNVSPHPQRVWKDWNTWGYFNLRLEWEAAGKTFSINRKTPRAWDGDFPDFWVLPPGETVVLVVDMASGQWEGFPDLYGERIPAKIRAIYENKPDILAEEFKVWVGKLETRPMEVIFK